MKTIVMILAFMLVGFITQAQSVVLDKDGKLVKTEAKAKTEDKTPDKVYATLDGITYYQGASGGIYCWKTSKKTGKEYKSYVPKKKEE